MKKLWYSFYYKQVAKKPTSCWPIRVAELERDIMKEWENLKTK